MDLRNVPTCSALLCWGGGISPAPSRRKRFAVTLRIFRAERSPPLHPKFFSFALSSSASAACSYRQKRSNRPGSNSGGYFHRYMRG